MSAKPRVMGLVFLTVFLDFVGFSIVFPLFPAMLDHYLAAEGAESAVGHLIRFLDDLSGGDRHAVVTLFGGVLGSIYSLLQFVFAPFWGGLSDRIGRRPTLVVTLTGTLLAYVLWVFAGSFLVLVAARILGGVMAGNVSTATAVVADTTKAKDRAAGMGLVGMAIGLGFILGPALGGFFSTLSIGGADGWGSGLALNPFSGPALVASALALVNLLWVAARFPETLPPERRGPSRWAPVWNPVRQVARLGFPGVRRTTLVNLLFVTSFAAMEFTLTFLAVERFAFTPRQNTWMFVFVGVVIALVQGGVVRRLAPRLGERRLVLAGLAMLVPGFFAIAWAQGTGMLYAGLFLMAVGSALTMPCLSALISRYVPADRQGVALGSFRSAGSLARAIGPILGGVLYWQLGSAALYWIGGLSLFLPLALASRLPTPAQEPVEEGGEAA